MGSKNRILSKINKKELGKIFTLRSLNEPLTRTNYRAIAKLLNEEKIQKVKGLKGCYFRPKRGVLGLIQPTESNIINCITEEGRKGYISGLLLYNQLKLTTQIPRIITVTLCKSTFATPRIAKVQEIEIKYKRSRVAVKENIEELQWLDILKNINKIPGTTPNSVIKTFKNTIKNKKLKKRKLLRLSQYYPPRVRALTGAVIENYCKKDQLKENINKIKSNLIKSGSIYKIRIDNQILPNKETWNID